MASIRLNTGMRSSIRLNLLYHGFREQVDDLIDRQEQFAAQVYNQVYNIHDRQRMESLPQGWLPERGEIGIQFGESSSGFTQLNLDGLHAIHNWLSKVRTKQRHIVKKRMPSTHAKGCAMKFDDDHPLTEEYYAFEKEREELMEQIGQASVSIESALNSFTTVGALVKNWPEVEPFVGQWAEVVANVPAIPVAELNNRLHLPVEEVAA